MALHLDACFFVDEPPEFEYKGGLFHVTFETGGFRTERVMRPSVFMLALRRAAECARKHNFAGAQIVEFARRASDDEASVA